MATQFIEEERKVLKPHLRFIKTFVPIFPSFYQNLDSGNAIGDHLNMMLYGEKELPANFENDSEKVHRVCQIKFSVKGNLLLDYEESREKLRIE